MHVQLALPEAAEPWLEALLADHELAETAQRRRRRPQVRTIRAISIPIGEGPTNTKLSMQRTVEGEPTLNKVILAGRLTRDPEMRALASGKHVTQFSLATTEYAGNGKERPEYHNVVTWDRLAEVCGRYLSKGQQVAIEGRLQTRTWDDDRGLRHWKTEIVATSVEMLSGRKKKDNAEESAAEPGTEAIAELVS
jgi:single-strand DNA-binding protein